MLRLVFITSQVDSLYDSSMQTFENLFKAENEVHNKMQHLDSMLNQAGF